MILMLEWPAVLAIATALGFAKKWYCLGFNRSYFLYSMLIILVISLFASFYSAAWYPPIDVVSVNAATQSVPRAELHFGMTVLDLAMIAGMLLSFAQVVVFKTDRATMFLLAAAQSTMLFIAYFCTGMVVSNQWL